MMFADFSFQDLPDEIQRQISTSRAHPLFYILDMPTQMQTPQEQDKLDSKPGACLFVDYMFLDGSGPTCHRWAAVVWKPD